MGNKQNIIVECACGHGCGAQMTVKEDGENGKLSMLSVIDNFKELPDFFVLDREGALALTKWLIAKYKLRDEIGGGVTAVIEKKGKRNGIQTPVIAVDLITEEDEIADDFVRGENDDFNNESVELPVELFDTSSLVTTDEPVKKKRGRPKGSVNTRLSTRKSNLNKRGK